MNDKCISNHFSQTVSTAMDYFEYTRCGVESWGEAAHKHGLEKVWSGYEPKFQILFDLEGICPDTK